MSVITTSSRPSWALWTIVGLPNLPASNSTLNIGLVGAIKRLMHSLGSLLKVPLWQSRFCRALWSLQLSHQNLVTLCLQPSLSCLSFLHILNQISVPDSRQILLWVPCWVGWERRFARHRRRNGSFPSWLMLHMYSTDIKALIKTAEIVVGLT